VAREVWVRSAAEGTGGPEAFAWAARADAELLRLRWLAGGDQPDLAVLQSAWHEAVRRFEDYGHAFEGARSRARLGGGGGAAGPPRGGGAAAGGGAAPPRLGAAPLLAEAQPLLGNRAPAREGGARPAEHLTPREREILSLVALGRSNKQIGSQLFISAKTASVHVSNIMAKLGAAGRGEAVAVARERGLLD